MASGIYHRSNSTLEVIISTPKSGLYFTKENCFIFRSILYYTFWTPRDIETVSFFVAHFIAPFKPLHIYLVKWARPIFCQCTTAERDLALRARSPPLFWGAFSWGRGATVCRCLVYELDAGVLHNAASSSCFSTPPHRHLGTHTVIEALTLAYVRGALSKKTTLAIETKTLSAVVWEYRDICAYIIGPISSELVSLT